MDSERLRNQFYRFRRRIAETAYSVIDEYSSVVPGTMPLTQIAVKWIPLRQATRQHHFATSSLDRPEQDQLVAQILLAHGDNRHPNIVRVQDVFIERDALFVVMEHCPEGDLLQHLQALPNGTALDEATAVGFIQQLLSGVQFLHTECDVAHRDISAENVLLHDGACKITDFGFSTRASQLCSDYNSANECYTPPELAAREPYDPMKADVWSLGMVLFIMLTGSPLAARPESGYRALRFGGVHAILVSWGLRHTLRTEVVALLSEMLQVDPDRRISVDAALSAASAL